MLGPIALASGMYHFNVRLPADLAAGAKGRSFALPLGDKVKLVVAIEKVACSPGTRDTSTAKVRFAEAYAALSRRSEALRTGPKPVTHKEAIALAGEAYRSRAEWFEDDPSLTPEAMEAERRQLDVGVAACPRRRDRHL